MADAPDLLAAELTAICDRAEAMRNRDVWTRVKAAESDRDRLLSLAQRVKRLADHWYAGRGNDYGATAQCASDLRAALREELLGEERNDGD